MSDIQITQKRVVEWPTLGLIAACYVFWGFGTTWLSELWLPLGMLITTLSIALHSSLTHELLHGHPFANARANEALAFPCLGLFIPYARFRDTHLAHHQDANLTDPYDDPESNYLDPTIWADMPRALRAIYRFNNTLLGRMLIGPALGYICFITEDLRAIRSGNKQVRTAWLIHIPAVLIVLVWIAHAPIPFWAYLICAYLALSLLKIRTFLEHQAHERARGRSVIIEDRGPFALLFLNNNLHLVHHMHPKVAWYELPTLYRSRKARYQDMNEGYVYRSYADIFRMHFLCAKDPVPHPLMKHK